MKSFALAALAVAVSAHKLDQEFMEHLMKYGQSFDTVKEFMFRKQLFHNVDKWIKEENSKGNNYTVGHNKLSTWTKAEKAALNGYIPSQHHEHKMAEKQIISNDDYSPVDWRTEGAVTPVKDQGQCGSCWTFSSTGAMEGAHFVKSGELLSFSEQQLVDCAHFIAFGCNGGNEATSFNYWKKNKVMSEASYPYTAVDTADCLYDADAAYDINVSSFIAVTPDSVDALKAALVTSPVSVNIEADKPVFQYYTGGVLDSTDCGTSIDHAVLAVGWGTDATAGDYWIVKNSWGEAWGDAGYINIAAVDGIGICGVQSGPYQPTSSA